MTLDEELKIRRWQTAVWKKFPRAVCVEGDHGPHCRVPYYTVILDPNDTSSVTYGSLAETNAWLFAYMHIEHGKILYKIRRYVGEKLINWGNRLTKVE